MRLRLFKRFDMRSGWRGSRMDPTGMHLALVSNSDRFARMALRSLNKGMSKYPGTFVQLLRLGAFDVIAQSDPRRTWTLMTVVAQI